MTQIKNISSKKYKFLLIFELNHLLDVESELEQPTATSNRQVAITDLEKIERLVMNQKRSQDQAR